MVLNSLGSLVSLMGRVSIVKMIIDIYKWQYLFYFIMCVLLAVHQMHKNITLILLCLPGHLINVVVLILPLRHIVTLYLHILTGLLLYMGHQISKWDPLALLLQFLDVWGVFCFVFFPIESAFLTKGVSNCNDPAFFFFLIVLWKSLECPLTYLHFTSFFLLKSFLYF